MAENNGSVVFNPNTLNALFGCHYASPAHVLCLQRKKEAKIIYESRHDKTNKVTVRAEKTQVTWASAQSDAQADQSLRYPMKKLCTLSYPLSGQRRL